MMFLLRSAFWLVILILLIPTDEAKQQQIYGTVRTALNDVTSFCERNPRTCASSQEAFDTLMRKAQTGGAMIMALVEEHSGSAQPAQKAAMTTPSYSATKPAMIAKPAMVNKPAPLAASPQPANGAAMARSANDPVMPVPSAVPLEPLPGEKAASQNTLSPNDLETGWGGPSI